MFNSRKDSPNSPNIIFDEMSESNKLHWALTKVCLDNKVGISSPFRFKLDTWVSSNLLSLSVYSELFPDCNIKDLGKTIDKSVQLLTATKSSNILTLYISEFITPSVISHTLDYFVVPNRCKPILGLSDLM